ncbi:QRFP-like peptide receptor [Tachypleus tridentatus]|uniref:QRFP-like peptide receptor n=1 Tax=Tachypleus tridentatus TaxID=6853 RepID=UPI003FD60A78
MTSTDLMSCNSSDLAEFNFSEFLFPQAELLTRTFSWQDYVKVTFYVLVIVVALVGNIGVILAVAFNRALRSTINCYLLNLSVADLFICAFCMWVHLVDNLFKPTYVFGVFMCKFNGFAQMTCLTSSVLTLSAIACDRFVGVLFPLRARITKQRTGLVISIIWLISMTVSIPFLIYRRHYAFQWKNFLEFHCGESWPQKIEYDPSLEKCITSYPSKQLYYTFITFTLFFIPVVIMTVAYTMIIWKLWVNKVPGERNQANINVQHNAKKKVIKLVTVVLGAFICCWMPFQVIVLYSQFGHFSSISGELPDWFPLLNYIATYIAYSNSALNPILFGSFGTNLRQGLCAVFFCKKYVISRNKPGSQRTRTTMTSGITVGSFHSRRFANTTSQDQNRIVNSNTDQLYCLTDNRNYLSNSHILLNSDPSNEALPKDSLFNENEHMI